MIHPSLWIAYTQQRQHELWREAEREAQARQLRPRRSRLAQWLGSLFQTTALSPVQGRDDVTSHDVLSYEEQPRQAA